MKILRQNFLQLTVEPFQEAEKPYEKRFEKIISEIRELNDHAELIYVSMYNPFTFTLSELNEINGVVTDWNHIAEKELKKINMQKSSISKICLIKKVTAAEFLRKMIFILMVRVILLSQSASIKPLKKKDYRKSRVTA